MRLARASCVTVCGVAALAVAVPAQATFPGRNGRIAFIVSTLAPRGLTEAMLSTVTSSGKRSRDIAQLVSAFDVTPAFSPSGDSIVYGTSWAGPRGGLVLLGADGRGDQQQLTQPRLLDPFTPYTEDVWPAFAPDGERIAFTRMYFNGPSITLAVRVYHGGRSRLVVTDASAPSWSVRNRIAFVRGDPQGIWTIRPDGGGLHKLLDRGREPDWSPDGRRIVFERGSSIMTARADGRRIRRVYTGGGSPVFSPDGRRIAFIRRGGLWTMTTRGRDVRRLVRAQYNVGLSSPAWQPLPLP